MVESKLVLDAAKILYRRQFALSSFKVDFLHEFSHHELKNGLFLMAHPELEVTESSNAHFNLVLLGFIIDPFHPGKTNQDILNDILEKSDSLESTVRNSINYSGRFILVAYDDQKMIAFNDPCGYRALNFYNKKDKFFLASDPNIIGKALSLPENPKVRNYLDTTPNIEHFLVAELTLYPDVSALLPNHYVDLNERKTHRFYPYKKIEPKSFKEAVKESATLLRNQIEAINHRYKLALPITAGFDSRSLLSVLKDKPDIHYFTLKFPWMSDQHQDTRMSREIVKKIGKDLQVIQTTDKMSEPFRKIYYSNTSTPHEYWGQMAESIWLNYPVGRVCLKGNSSEIARKIYGPFHNWQMTLDKLCYAVKIESDFIKESLRDWFDEVLKLGKELNLEVTDMFHWEIRQGRWQSASQLEWDLIHETFTPFSCRPLIEAMLSCPEKYRFGPHFRLHRAIMKSIWKGALDLPFNPDEFTFKYNLLFKVRNLMIRLDLISLVANYSKYKHLFYGRKKFEKAPSAGELESYAEKRLKENQMRNN